MQVSGQVQGPYYGTYRLSWPGHNTNICNPYPGIQSGDVGTFEITYSPGSIPCEVTIHSQDIQRGPAYPPVRNPNVNYDPVSTPEIYPEEGTPVPVTISSYAAPIRSTSFSIAPVPNLVAAPGSGSTVITRRSPSVPTLGGGGVSLPSLPSVPSSPTTSNPLGPVIDYGCSQLPTWLQGACQAAGGWLTNTGSPGGSGGQAVPGTDPTPTTTTPAERSVGASGFSAPMLVQRNRLECLPAPDGSRQVLYYSPMTGEQVCLPRSGGAQLAKAFGLVRKWKPRPKPKWTAHDAKMMKKYGPGGSMQKKVKAMAGEAGLTCRTRGR